MAELTTQTDARLEKMASNAARNAVRKSRIEKDIDIPDQFTSEDVDNLVDNTPDDAADDLGIGFDIFDFCDKLQKKRGDLVSYMVKRNGEMLTVKPHPCSWEQLQHEYGPGQYQIVAKSITTKKYLKTETRVVADTEQSWRKKNPHEKPQVQMQAPPPPSMDFKEMFVMMNQMQEAQKQEAKEQLRESSKSQENQMMMMLEMMKTSSNQGSAMFLEMAKMTQTVSEKLSASQAAMFEKMESRFEKVIEKLATNARDVTPPIDPFQILKMTKDAEESGFNRMAQLLTFARSEAEERYSDRDEKSGKSEKKSLTDTLIESMLPTITSALTGQAFGQASKPMAAAHPAMQPRRALPQTRPTIPAKASQPNQATRTVNQAVKPIIKSSDQSRNALNSIGLPSTSFDETPLSEHDKLPTITEIEDWLSPIIGESLIQRTPVLEAGPKVLEVIQNRGLSKENFCKIITEQSMIDLVSKFGLPEEANGWFKELYAYISSATGTITG